MAGVEILDGKQNITVQEAYNAGARARQLAENAKPLKEHGTNQHREEEKKESGHYHDNVQQQGTSSLYLTARIARDHPDIHERMKAGEFKSVRAAAIEAGIVKPNSRVTISVSQSETPEQFAAKILERFDRDFLEGLKALTEKRRFNHAEPIYRGR